MPAFSTTYYNVLFEMSAPKLMYNTVEVNMARTKRTKAELEIDRVEVSYLKLQGYTNLEVANTINSKRPYNLTQQQYGQDWKAVQKRWLQAQERNVEAWVADELMRLNVVEELAFQDHSDSRQSRHGPDPRFLAIILKVHEKRAKLLDLYAPTRVEIIEDFQQWCARKGLDATVIEGQFYDVIRGHLEGNNGSVHNEDHREGKPTDRPGTALAVVDNTE